VARSDLSRISKLFGLRLEAVRALERRGLLRELDIDETEIRERLWRGHLAHLGALPISDDFRAHSESQLLKPSKGGRSE